ncbi:MAG: hypothetical protein ACPLXP_00300 [Microgenomates group bacterium]
MDFYHNLITQKSWQLLTNLKKRYEFILIGGWAVFLYTKALKSKDIDVVMEFEELEKMRNEFAVSKNERLRKYEARKEETEIDIYVPFYSNPGIPAEEIKKFTSQLEGFIVAQKEVLAVLKQKAFLERRNTPKGRKDLADLVSLFCLEDFDWQKYRNLVGNYRLEAEAAAVAQIINQTFSLEEIGLNVHQMARLKAKILPKIEKKDG